MAKPLSVQALERVGKNWSKASLTRVALIQNIKAFTRFLKKIFGLMWIVNLKPGHVSAYVKWMHDSGLSAGTMANRMSAVRYLADAIGKKNIVYRTNLEYGISRSRMNPVLANRDKIDQIKTALADKAQQGDRIAMMAYAAAQLRDVFGLRSKESLLSSSLSEKDGKLYLQIDGAKGGRLRDLEITTPEQLLAVQHAVQVSEALGSGTGRIIPPELSLKQAYDAQRSLWRELGGSRRDKSHMHAQRHDRFQRMHNEGASNKQIMHDAGHGEDRSPGHYIPK